ncbi:MAG: hypothetical protein Q9175_000560 [Cornicularia normoerica]
MAEVHQSPVVHPSKQVESKETLVRFLDDLLERYLHLLDRYQTLQQFLAQLLSKGYLSLAQANFSTPNRVRYGQNHYDDRMKASAQDAEDDEDDADDEVDTAKESTIMDDTRAPFEVRESRSKKTRDPLNWFGILVPPALRTSQSSFKDAVAGPIPTLASILKEMREVEIEVKRARKRIWKAA